MIIATNLVFKGFDAVTVWPFLLVRPSAINDAALVEHELVHYREQRRVLTIPWLLRYWLSKKFRLAAEVRAYQRQIEVGGITVQAAAVMLQQYGLGITLEQAHAALTA